MPTAIIVDDSPVMRSQLRAILTTAGFTVTTEAPDANNLDALYLQHRPDLIALDIVMPGRDGVTAATELLAAYPDAVIVMCSSLASREKVKACKAAGVRHYLLKPLDPDLAVQVFRGALTRVPATPPSSVVGVGPGKDQA